MEHFWSLGGLLDGIGASLSPLGGPWGPLGAPRVDFHRFWEPFWRSLGGQFSCFFHHKFKVYFEVDLGMDFKHIFVDCLMMWG